MCNIKSDNPKEKQCCFCRMVTAICFFISVALLIAGFLLPPMGIIDGSVLTAVGELLLFPVVIYGFRAIELGLEVKIQKGDTSVEIHKDDGDGNQD
jgi:sugar phosphate permease